MTLLYSATDPTGAIHRSSDEDAFDAILNKLQAQFPDGRIRVRADTVQGPQHIGDILGPILGDIQRSRKPGGRK